MPTGYTSDIYEDKDSTLRGFAIKCAGNFIRYEGKLPYEVEPECIKGYDEKIKELQAEQARIMGLSLDECHISAEEERRERRASDLRFASEKLALRKRYQKMLIDVRQWNVPERLKGLREFMISQLELVIDHDTKGYTTDEPQAVSATLWRGQKLKDIHRDIEFYIRESDSAINRASEVNDWLREFWDRLPEEGA